MSRTARAGDHDHADEPHRHQGHAAVGRGGQAIPAGRTRSGGCHGRERDRRPSAATGSAIVGLALVRASAAGPIVECDVRSRDRPAVAGPGSVASWRSPSPASSSCCSSPPCRRWSWPSPGLPVDLADRRHGARRHAGRRRRQRHQHVRRPRHRRADGAHQAPPAGHRGHDAHARRWCSPSALEVAAFALAVGLVNLLSAVLAVAASPLLRVRLHALAEAHLAPEHRDRRRRRRGAGARRLGGGHRPPRWAPVVLFAVIFFWTPPHFWALAIRYRDDYAAADVPMLPVGRQLRATTAARILGYTVVALGADPRVRPGGRHGRSLPRGRGRARRRVHLAGRACSCGPSPPKVAMRLFSYSITYVTLLFGAMAVDQLVRWGH